MTITDALASSPTLLIASVAVLGLLVGSFLNVVSLRLPRMMEAAWKRDSRSMLDLPEDADAKTYSLVSPPSTCASCGGRIRAWHNVPVVSWLWLRGRCAYCSAAISPQYPLVELACGVMSAICAWRFGWSPQLAAALVLTWALVVLTVIDLREHLLPDDITLPLMWIGLGMSVFEVFVGAHASIAGAAFGYLSLWSIYHAFRLLTGKEGMGYGDFKLLAALGAWFGAFSLPLIILLSSLVGAVVGIALIVFRGRERSSAIAFGPYLAGAGWITLIWGQALGRLILPH
ncbi:MAG: prepilin peptidase [Nevskia sp.]|nr:prepilin peptidase [Nevskia sp.]